MSQRCTALVRNDTPPVGQTPAEMVAAMPSDQRAIVKKMEMTVHRVTGHVLQAYTELGRLVLRLQDSRRQRHDYGDQTIIKLADYLNVNARTLYDCQKVAQAIPKEMLKDLRKPGVVWGHVLLLSQFCGVLPGGEQDLEIWAHRISSERLTVNQLRKLSIRGRLVAPSTNDKPKKRHPKSLRATFKKLEKLATTFMDRSKNELFGGDGNATAVAKLTPSDTYTDELRQQISNLADLMDEVSGGAANHAKGMRELLVIADRCIAARKKGVESEEAANDRE